MQDSFLKITYIPTYQNTFPDALSRWRQQNSRLWLKDIFTIFYSNNLWSFGDMCCVQLNGDMFAGVQ